MRVSVSYLRGFKKIFPVYREWGCAHPDTHMHVVGEMRKWEETEKRKTAAVRYVWYHRSTFFFVI